VPPRLTAPQRRRGRTRGKSDAIDALAIARAALQEPHLHGPQAGEQVLHELKLPVIIPPIYAKQSFIHLVAPAWIEARRALERCDRMVFFGYSLPPADIEAEKLFQRAITANSDLRAIEIVNPDPLAPSRYATLAPRKPLRWYPDLDRYLAETPFEHQP
jgi:hypothetical protein